MLQEDSPNHFRNWEPQMHTYTGTLRFVANKTVGKPKGAGRKANYPPVLYYSVLGTFLKHRERIPAVSS